MSSLSTLDTLTGKCLSFFQVSGPVCIGSGSGEVGTNYFNFCDLVQVQSAEGAILSLTRHNGGASGW